ncbi:CLUMA_CG010738, isoform A [Clunio marinus]|uniref:CLUMA_CG010738, isoform A n=1 Tax=Clunio marinus TaxID=568069 RepID=A0A1J1IAV9_9DIPT|nr:CLUMA_CG010738, isoform A [Clunio marinus]
MLTLSIEATSNIYKKSRESKAIRIKVLPTPTQFKLKIYCTARQSALFMTLMTHFLLHKTTLDEGEKLNKSFLRLEGGDYDCARKQWNET